MDSLNDASFRASFHSFIIAQKTLFPLSIYVENGAIAPFSTYTSSFPTLAGERAVLTPTLKSAILGTVNN